MFGGKKERIKIHLEMSPATCYSFCFGRSKVKENQGLQRDEFTCIIKFKQKGKKHILLPLDSNISVYPSSNLSFQFRGNKFLSQYAWGLGQTQAFYGHICK